MIDRIKQIIQETNSAPSAFADQIGVPRSTISHILSGRNKPSLELCQKILDAFPGLRTEWLVRGRGMMWDRQHNLFSSAQAEIEERGSKKVPEQTGQSEVQRQADHSKGESMTMSDKEKGVKQRITGVQDKESVEGDPGSPSEERTKGPVPPVAVTPNQSSSKRIIKVLTLLEDGSFIEYRADES